MSLPWFCHVWEIMSHLAVSSRTSSLGPGTRDGIMVRSRGSSTTWAWVESPVLPLPRCNLYNQGCNLYIIPYLGMVWYPRPGKVRIIGTMHVKYSEHCLEHRKLPLYVNFTCFGLILILPYLKFLNMVPLWSLSTWRESCWPHDHLCRFPPLFPQELGTLWLAITWEVTSITQRASSTLLGLLRTPVLPTGPLSL